MSDITEPITITGVKEKARETAEKVRQHRLFKPVLIAVAIGIGTFYGTRQPMQSIRKDVATMADRTKRIDHNLFTFANHQMNHTDFVEAEKLAMREDLAAAERNGDKFTYYPGLGVYIHGDKKAKAS